MSKREEKAGEANQEGSAMLIELTVPGVPVPKLRPSVTCIPDKTMGYMDSIRAEWLGHYDWWQAFSRGEPLAMEARFYLLRPKSAPKRRKRPVVRPETSDLLRAVEDSLTGYAFPNDAAIVFVMGMKEYSANPRTEIRIWEL